jgi:hypothetical protein
MPYFTHTFKFLFSTYLDIHKDSRSDAILQRTPLTYVRADAFNTRLSEKLPHKHGEYSIYCFLAVQ